LIDAKAEMQLLTILSQKMGENMQHADEVSMFTEVSNVLRYSLITAP